MPPTEDDALWTLLRNGVTDQADDARPMGNTVNVRYKVDDVDEAINLYTRYLGFSVLSNQVPGIRRRPSRQSSAAAQRTDALGRTSDARRTPAGARWLEPYPFPR
jgi:hypothetical protein